MKLSEIMLLGLRFGGTGAGSCSSLLAGSLQQVRVGGGGWVGRDLVQCVLTAPSHLFPGTLAPRVPCMERGRGTNHVMPSNDTSWSAHHPPLAQVQASCH